MGARRRRWPFEDAYPLFARVALLAAWGLGLLVAFRGIQQAVTADTLGSDAHAYWLAAQGPVSYERVPGEVDAFLYSPAFAWAIRPPGLLPWPAFFALWTALAVLILLWLLRPVPARWAPAFALLAVPELIVGNVLLLIAASVVLGMRYPAAWAVPLLTKVTSGVGVLWFAVRRDWRSLGTAAATTMGILVATSLMDAQMWRDWIGFLLDNSNGSRDGLALFTLRVVVAIALIAYGAHRDHAWLIAPATALAAPILNPMTLTLLAAIPRLLEVGAGGPARQFKSSEPAEHP